MASGFLPKPISGLLIAVMIANSVLFALIFQPQPARAQFTDPINASIQPVQLSYQIADSAFAKAEAAKDTAVQTKTGLFEFWDRFKSSHGVIAEIVSSLLLVAMHQVLAKITNDIVAWINGGGKGKLRILQDPGKFLTDAFDEAGGVLAGAILGIDPASLCNADYLKYTLKAQLTGPYAVPTFPEKVACTFSGAAKGLQNFQKDFRNGGWASFVQLLDKPNNQIGQTLLTLDELNRIKATKTQEAQAEIAIGKGFLNQKKCTITQGINGNIQYVAGTSAAKANQIGDSVISGADVVGADIEDVMDQFGYENAEEFKGYWISQGGMIDCKIITPGETIKALADKALLAPYERLEQSIQAMTNKLGTGAGSVLKPYVLAIANATLNLMLKKEKGLISDALAGALRVRDRRAQRQPSDSLQNNAQLSQSAGALAGSVNDFRSFLLKALLDFNIFITTTANTMDLGDQALGRMPIDESNYDATSCVIPTVANPNPIDPVSGISVSDPAIFTATKSCFTDNRYGYVATGGGLYGPGWSASGNHGWPWNGITPPNTGADFEFGPGDQYKPYAVTYNTDGTVFYKDLSFKDDKGNPLVNIYINQPSKVFVEEAQWCGAYAQEIAVPNSTVSNPYIAFPSTTTITLTDIMRVTGPSYCPDGQYMSGLNRLTLGGSDNETQIICSPAPVGLVFPSTTSTTTTDVMKDTGPSYCPDGQYMSGLNRDTPPLGSYNLTQIICSPAPVGLVFPSTTSTTLTGSMVLNGSNTCPDGQYMSGLNRLTLGGNDNETQIICSPAPVYLSTKTTELVDERYISPTFEGGTVTLRREKVSFFLSSLGATTTLESVAANALLLRGNFYPELMEKMQELMEKVRVIEGYHYPATTVKDYLSPLADQLGANPDDDPTDNSPSNANYNDDIRPNVSQDACPRSYVWTPNNPPGNPPLGTCSFEGYKGSVTDVLTKYNDLAQIYQQLFAGLQDENSLEGVDKDFKILSPEESNIRLAMIGKRCPVLPPSAGDPLYEKCPRFGHPVTGEYNMARKFVFEEDSSAGITTGFATNPFTRTKSSSLAGLLNLEEMTTQLGSLPPDKNIVKLIRLRQLLEQVQVWRSMTQNTLDLNYRKALGEIKIPNKTAPLIPDALTGVDLVQVSLSGYEKIQDWLNATSTTDSAGAIVPAKNQDIQTLIEAYGYITAKEAYPQISKELDDILDDAVNQIADKLKDVFLKRTELALEQARVNAQERLRYFIEYIRDLNSVVKLEVDSSRVATLLPAITTAGYNSFIKQIESNTHVLGIDGTVVFDTDQTKINNLLTLLNGGEKTGLIGSAIYKIKTLARFIGIDTGTEDFLRRISDYTNGDSSTVDDRLKNALEDAYLYYTGVTNFRDTGPVITGGCSLSPLSGLQKCTLTTGNPLFKDARMKLEELNNDFNLMTEETSRVKQEFQDLTSSISQDKQGIEDMQELFSTMLSDYDDANACFGFSTDPANLWQMSASQKISYNSMSPVLYSLAAGAVAAGAVVWGAGLAGVAITTAAIGLATFGVGIIVMFAIGSWLSRKAKKKARKKAEAARVRLLTACAQGVDNFNRHLGQLADNFVCGKINKKYQGN